jgi:hypothetical protein
MKTINSKRVVLTISIVAALLTGTAIASFGSSSSKSEFKQVVKVTHGKVDASNSQRVDLGAPGPSAGDILSYYLPLTSSKDSYLTGTLTVTASNQPTTGIEVRIADLVFSIGNQSDQLVVGGSAVYDTLSPTLAIGIKTIRPVLGGSGKFAGARGFAESVQRQDGSWSHNFYLRY